jgi:hypothetical protein
MTRSRQRYQTLVPSGNDEGAAGSAPAAPSAGQCYCTTVIRSAFGGAIGAEAEEFAAR